MEGARTVIRPQIHTPVFLREALQYLDARPGAHIIDATADGGGHAVAIARAIQPGGKLLAIEWDDELFQILAERFKEECTPFSKSCVLERTSYTELERVVRSLAFGPVAGVLFDFGLSSFHLERSRRGFSFQREEPLDMRYSRTLPETAADILARSSAADLTRILKQFGEERFAARIAKLIVATRRNAPITNTKQLVESIRRAVPAQYRRVHPHPATRTFQALRIAVNHELEHITLGLGAAAQVLAPRGRIVAISFHSLEDRTVKHFFRSEHIAGQFRSLLGRPLRPEPDEIHANPRSRSAILRAYEKLP